MNDTKLLTVDELKRKFNANGLKKQVRLLFKALEILQKSKNSSIDDCIFASMGYGLADLKNRLYSKVD